MLLYSSNCQSWAGTGRGDPLLYDNTAKTIISSGRKGIEGTLRKRIFLLQTGQIADKFRRGPKKCQDFFFTITSYLLIYIYIAFVKIIILPQWLIWFQNASKWKVITSLPLCVLDSLTWKLRLRSWTVTCRSHRSVHLTWLRRPCPWRDTHSQRYWYTCSSLTTTIIVCISQFHHVYHMIVYQRFTSKKIRYTENIVWSCIYSYIYIYILQHFH